MARGGGQTGAEGENSMSTIGETTRIATLTSRLLAARAERGVVVRLQQRFGSADAGVVGKRFPLDCGGSAPEFGPILLWADNGGESPRKRDRSR